MKWVKSWHTPLLLKECHDRSRGGGCCGIKFELGVDFGHERLGCLQHRYSRPKAIARVSPQVPFYPHMGRFEQKLRCFKSQRVWPPTGAISERFTHGLPGDCFLGAG